MTVWRRGHRKRTDPDADKRGTQRRITRRLHAALSETGAQCTNVVELCILTARGHAFSQVESHIMALHVCSESGKIPQRAKEMGHRILSALQVSFQLIAIDYKNVLEFSMNPDRYQRWRLRRCDALARRQPWHS